MTIERIHSINITETNHTSYGLFNVPVFGKPYSKINTNYRTAMSYRGNLEG